MSILNELQMNQVVTRIATDLKQGDPRYYLGYLGGSIDVVDGVLFEVHLGARPNLSLPVCSPSTCFTCFFSSPRLLTCRHAWPIEIKVEMAEEPAKKCRSRWVYIPAFVMRIRALRVARLMRFPRVHFVAEFSRRIVASQIVMAFWRAANTTLPTFVDPFIFCYCVHYWKIVKSDALLTQLAYISTWSQTNSDVWRCPKRRNSSKMMKYPRSTRYPIDFHRSSLECMISQGTVSAKYGAAAGHSSTWTVQDERRKTTVTGIQTGRADVLLTVGLGWVERSEVVIGRSLVVRTGHWSWSNTSVELNRT